MPKAAKAKTPITVVERRLKSGKIFGTSSKPIPLNEPDVWTVRMVYSKISNSHLYDMQAEKGWVYASASDLAVKPEEVGLREQDGRLVRGIQGDEVLMKMLLSDYRLIQKEKDRVNRKQTFGNKALKEAVVTRASEQEDGGDEGADFLSRSINRITVTDMRGGPDE